MLVKRGSKWCVVHSEDEGKIIKCYSFKKFGKTGAYNRANKMHKAIIVSKKNRAEAASNLNK